MRKSVIAAIVVGAMLILPIVILLVWQYVIIPFQTNAIMNNQYVTHVGGYEYKDIIGEVVAFKWTEKTPNKEPRPYCTVRYKNIYLKSLLVDYDENGDAVGAYFWPTVEWMKHDDERFWVFDNPYTGGYVYMDFLYNEYTKCYHVKNLTFLPYSYFAGIHDDDLFTYWDEKYAEQ